MKRSVLLFVLLLFGVLCHSQGVEQSAIIQSVTNIDSLEQLLIQYNVEKQENMNRVQQWLGEHQGWEQNWIDQNDNVNYIYKVENGIPRIITTNNLTSANIIRTSEVVVGGSSGLNLNGSGMLISMWDSYVQADHFELQGRVTKYNPGEWYNGAGHGTHVACTMIGMGILTPTINGIQIPHGLRGMANDADLKTYPLEDHMATLPLIGIDGSLVGNFSFGDVNGCVGFPLLGQC